MLLGILACDKDAQNLSHKPDHGPQQAQQSLCHIMSFCAGAHLRDAAGRCGDAVQAEVAERLVVSHKLTLTLQESDISA